MLKNPNCEAQTFQRGDILSFIATADRNAGEVINIAGMVGIVNADVKTGRMGEASIAGVYLFDNSGITPVTGEKVDFSLASKNVVASGGGDFPLGTVADYPEVASATDPIPVIINKAPLT